MIGNPSPMTSGRLRELFLEYFRVHKHAILPSASLIPENDPTVLFTTAGMHPLVPYLLGQPHPKGSRLANVQKCLRTDDIDEVGDASHLTFFEMLGSWSLGDYFKDEAIAMSFEFLTADRWLDIPIERLAVTCFAGDADAPKDTTSAAIWKKLGIPEGRITFCGKKDNWWGPPGRTGPCGPDTEMFVDTGRGPAVARPNDGTGRFVEIWNDVFMEYKKEEDGSLTQLTRKNVDTGMGLERTVAALNGLSTVYETDLFVPIIGVLKAGIAAPDERRLRVAADHLRAAIFLLADSRSIVPSNVEQGYIVRRLLRRAFRAVETREGAAAATADVTDVTIGLVLKSLTEVMARIYGTAYPEVSERAGYVAEALAVEHATYRVVRLRAERALKRRQELGKRHIEGREAFDLYQSFGFHPDLLRSLGAAYGVTVDLAGFEEEFAKHQGVSRAGIQDRFAGGLADHSARVVRMHTATHLLHAALRHVLGDHIQQKGSNITTERLRFDFSHPGKLTAEELHRVEGFVNAQVQRDLPVTRAEMTPEEAKRQGALGFFGERYGDRVNVYTIGDISKEICGGPHVSHTGAVGQFRIVKEEGLSAGIRRLRAVVDG